MQKEIKALLESYHVRGNPSMKYVEVPFDTLLSIKRKMSWYQIQAIILCLALAAILAWKVI